MVCRWLHILSPPFFLLFPLRAASKKKALLRCLSANLNQRSGHFLTGPRSAPQAEPTTSPVEPELEHSQSWAETTQTPLPDMWWKCDRKYQAGLAKRNGNRSILKRRGKIEGGYDENKERGEVEGAVIIVGKRRGEVKDLEVEEAEKRK